MDESSKEKFRKLDDKQGVSGSTSTTSTTQLCDLPDSLLHGILSCLSTKYVVRTSVLSNRWQHVWESMPYLRFDQQYDYPTGSPNFYEFVDRALFLRDMSSSVKEFSLTCTTTNGSSRINRWVTAALKSNVEVLKVLLYDDYYRPYVLPHCIFRSESLLNLELRMNALLRIPSDSTYCLSNLKVLSLEYVTFVDDDSTQKLLSCPTLEELRIRYCDWRHLKAVKIFAPKLLVLSIFDNDYTNEQKVSAACHCQVLIQAAQIRSFRYSGAPIKQYCICTSSLQLKADLYLDLCKKDSLRPRITDNAYELLKGLSSVWFLNLNYVALKFLSCGADELLNDITTFSNMTELILDCRADKGYRVSWMILERSPYLETLEFKVQDHPIPIHVPICFQSHLKKIVIHGFKDGEEHISIVARLLGLAMVLEEIVIHYSLLESSMMKAEELLKRLTQLPKGSAKCKISLMVLRIY